MVLGPPEADHAAVASGKHTRRLKIAPFAATAQSNPPRRRRITHQPHECECKDLSASLPIASFPCANLMIRGHLRRHQGPRSSSWTLAITSTETSKVWFFLPSSGRHDRRAKHLCRALFLHGLISLDENLARLRKKKKSCQPRNFQLRFSPFFVLTLATIVRKEQLCLAPIPQSVRGTHASGVTAATSPQRPIFGTFLEVELSVDGRASFGLCRVSRPESECVPEWGKVARAEGVVKKFCLQFYPLLSPD